MGDAHLRVRYGLGIGPRRRRDLSPGAAGSPFLNATNGDVHAAHTAFSLLHLAQSVCCIWLGGPTSQPAPDAHHYLDWPAEMRPCRDPRGTVPVRLVALRCAVRSWPTNQRRHPLLKVDERRLALAADLLERGTREGIIVKRESRSSFTQHGKLAVSSCVSHDEIV